MSSFSLASPSTFQQNRLNREAYFQNLVMQGSAERIRQKAIEQAKKEQEEAERKAKEGGIWGAVAGGLGGAITGFISGGGFSGALLGAAKGAMGGFQAGDPAKGALIGAAEGAIEGIGVSKREEALKAAALEKAEQASFRERQMQLLESQLEEEKRQFDIKIESVKTGDILKQMNEIAKKTADEQKIKTDQENLLFKTFDTKIVRFNEISNAKNKINTSLNANTAAGDLAGIFAFMKVLDPGSTVREGEFSNAQNSAGIPDRIRSLYNRALSGNRLGEEQRKDFLKTAKNLFATEQKAFERDYTRIKSIAENKKLDLVNIFGDLNIKNLNFDVAVNKKSTNLIKKSITQKEEEEKDKSIFKFGGSIFKLKNQ